jgi:hypothetical protein
VRYVCCLLEDDILIGVVYWSFRSTDLATRE